MVCSERDRRAEEPSESSLLAGLYASRLDAGLSSTSQTPGQFRGKEEICVPQDAPHPADEVCCSGTRLPQRTTSKALAEAHRRTGEAPRGGLLAPGSMVPGF